MKMTIAVGLAILLLGGSFLGGMATGKAVEDKWVKASCDDIDAVTVLGGQQYVCLTLKDFNTMRNMLAHRDRSA